MNEYDIIRHPVATEKAVRLMEEENKMTFIVSLKSSKKEIKEAVEKAFKVKVRRVNTLVTVEGKKKAYVSLSSDTPAIDVATELGLT
tara:strand:+ start:1270 stop:1530 length:261 start_codon:yes stop_codon:yes gene_type:complete